MKTTFTRLVFSGMLASAMLLTSCAASEEKSSPGGAIPRYVTPDEIKAIPACRATVEERYPCYSVFKTADGKKFLIGSPAAPNEVINFLTTLKQGQTCKFPALFLEYQKSQKAPNERS